MGLHGLELPAASEWVVLGNDKCLTERRFGKWVDEVLEPFLNPAKPVEAVVEAPKKDKGFFGGKKALDE